MATDRSARPNAIPWPPLLFAGCALAALGLHQAVPLRLAVLHATLAEYAGYFLAAAGIGLDVWAAFTMRRHHANIRPNRAATALVTSGPFALSRNPIYLGNTILLVGAGLAFAIAWFLPMALLAAVLVTHLAIRREEAHLNARFGAAWRDYAARTPRWLPRASTRRRAAD